MMVKVKDKNNELQSIKEKDYKNWVCHVSLKKWTVWDSQ